MILTNEQLALQFIYASSSTTRSDLAKSLGLSHATVMRLISDLTGKGYVVENSSNSKSNSRGRPSNTLSINPDYGVAVGVEFGRDKMILSFLSADGTFLDTAEIMDVPDFHPSEETLRSLIDVVFQEAKAFDISKDQIVAFGLALHGLVSSNGEWITLQHILDTPFPVQDYLTSELDISVKVDDISRAFAFAEHRWGAGQNKQDMLYLYVGRRGIGSGIFVNDKLLQSSLGICGEIGHMIVEEDGDLCQCGNHGCLETVATYNAVVGRVQKRIAEGALTSLSDITDLTFDDICDAYVQGDNEARIALDQLAAGLGKALASTIIIVGSTNILIGGDLRKAGDAFLIDLERILNMKIIPRLAHRITVRYAELPNYAGSWGIAIQALDSVWDVSGILEIVS